MSKSCFLVNYGVRVTVHLGALQEVLHQLDSRASSHLLSPLDCIIPSREERQGNQGVSSPSTNAKHLLDPRQLHLCNLRVLGIPALQSRQQECCCKESWCADQACMCVVGCLSLSIRNAFTCTMAASCLIRKACSMRSSSVSVQGVVISFNEVSMSSITAQ